jgi:paired amphipathic helix protein Sin3a
MEVGEAKENEKARPQGGAQPRKTLPRPVSRGPKLKVEDALAYIAKVKMEFGGDKNGHIYNQFLDIMKSFKAHEVDTPGVIKQVSDLFEGRNDLILGFNTFLPADQRIKRETLERVAAAGGRGMQSAQHGKQAEITEQPFGFGHAISYVTKIKRRFLDDPDTYKTFLDILHMYKEKQRSIEVVLEQISHLFRNHTDLLKGFATFLPEAVQSQAKAALDKAATRTLVSDPGHDHDLSARVAALEEANLALRRENDELRAGKDGYEGEVVLKSQPSTGFGGEEKTSFVSNVVGGGDPNPGAGSGGTEE